MQTPEYAAEQSQITRTN